MNQIPVKKGSAQATAVFCAQKAQNTLKNSLSPLLLDLTGGLLAEVSTSTQVSGQLKLVVLYVHRCLPAQQLKQQGHPLGRDRLDQAFEILQAAVTQAHFEPGLKGTDFAEIGSISLTFASPNGQKLLWF
ncbi:hypothetical protein LP416_30175 [Polaromonas sp. P2-4]|nr:hypothetical protein LP416_30175 [Polaromonas sp. P2-4]